MTVADPDAIYCIMAGVHRCVAAREAGLAGIYAEIMDDDGFVLRHERVLLTRLYSPKPTIDRWDRRWDFADLVAVMRTVTGRANIETVTVSPVSAGRAARLTPLLDVVATGYPGDTP